MYVYLMHEPSTAGRTLVKVGISDNPSRRLRENTTGSPHDLVLRSSFLCGDKARFIEGLVKKQFKAHATKKRGEWFAVDLDVIESFIVSLVRMHCGYDPLVEDRIREERRRYLEAVGHLDGEEEVSSFGDADEEMRLSKRLRIAREFPVEAGDVPFVEWYESYSQHMDQRPCGLERLGKSGRARILNVEALIAVLSSGELYDDDERDQIPGYADIVEYALDLWGQYKNTRRLSDVERKKLYDRLTDFASEWRSMEGDRTSPLPVQVIGGRGISVLGDKECRIYLGFGFALNVRLAFDGSELLYPSDSLPLNKQTGRPMLAQSHVRDAWLTGTHYAVSPDRHLAITEVREAALASFLQTSCRSCMRPGAWSTGFSTGTCLKELMAQIEQERVHANVAGHKAGSAYRAHARELTEDVTEIARLAFRLYATQPGLRADVDTGEFDHVHESDVTTIDTHALMETIACGKSFKGRQMLREMRHSEESATPAP